MNNSFFINAMTYMCATFPKKAKPPPTFLPTGACLIYAVLFHGAVTAPVRGPATTAAGAATIGFDRRTIRLGQA
jgi:hypothetical protein